MFARVFVVALAALPIFAAAGSPSNQCNTGSTQCCNQLQNKDNLSEFVKKYLSSVNVNVDSITGQVGVTCSPITAVGGAATSCSQQPVCCTNNSFNGVVALGCSPVEASA